MRLTSMTLQRYGNYDAEHIRFDASPGKVNILLAANSAGKSVLRNAVADLLFGIHNQTPMDFRFGYAGMGITAEILRRDGSSAAFRRRKTRGNIVTGLDDQPLEPGFLRDILGSRDRKLLERLFVLDTEGLRRGGADLLESDGDVASALLSAAGGIRQARALKQSLEQKRDELAPERRTSSRPFYQALDRFLEARRRTGAETLRPDAWFRLEQELAGLEERRKEQNLKADQASAEIARLERIRRVRRWLAQLTNATAWLEAHPRVPKLGAEPRRALEAATREMAIKEQVARSARDALATAEQNAEVVTVNIDLLACSEQIKGLVDEAGGARTAGADLPGRQTELELCHCRIRDLLRQLDVDLPPERAAEILPSRALLARTRLRIKEHGERDATVQAAPALISARESQVAELERQLRELPPERDLRRLEPLLEEVLAGGDPTTRRMEAEASLAEADAALNAALARVPAWSGGVDVLAALRPPAIEVWRRIDTDMTSRRGEIATANARLDDETAKLGQATDDLTALSRGDLVPDDDAVARARSHRDSGWRLIYRRAFTADPPSAAEEAGFAGEVPLPLAFERAITEADTIADRRAAGSEALGRLEAARQAVAAAEQRLVNVKERSRLSHEALFQTRRTWARLCDSMGQKEDAELADIQMFLNARDHVINTSQRYHVAASAVSSLVARHGVWREALAATLDEVPSTLPALLGLADKILSEARERQRRRAELDTLHLQSVKELHDAVAMRVAAQKSLDAWGERWRMVLVELGRPETEEPVATESVLQTIGDLEKEVLKATSLAERINGMESLIERFTRSVQEVRRSLPGLDVAINAFDTVRDLDRLLDEERARNQRCQMLRDNLEKARVAYDLAERDLATAQTNLNAILTIIGADTVEAAAHRLALSDERAAFEAKHDEAETELREAGDGYSIEILRAAANEHPADEDTARIEAAAAMRRQASEAAQQAAEDASRSRQSMEQKGNETAVNAAAADQQAAIASLSGTLDEALLYHTASLLLSRALDAVEKTGGSDMLRRISAVFNTLTCGLYTRVASEPDDTGKAELVMIQRDFPEERQHIGQLSEGTRDQLYLALRVAAIEDHLTSAEPLPFIGDDILQSFDDDRALAALRVLADLSVHTQVIVLTHHRHVMDLASRMPDGSVFRCERETLATTVQSAIV